MLRKGELNEYFDVKSHRGKRSIPEDHPRLRKLDLPHGDRVTQIANFVCETTLPQCVSLSKDFCAEGRKCTFLKGDILMLHFIYEDPVVVARDTTTWRRLLLPVNAKQEYELLPTDPALDEKEYDSTEELIEADPLPAAVRILKAHSSHHPEESWQKKGDVIEIQRIQFDKEEGKVIVGTLNGSQVRLSRLMTTSKYSTMISTEFHRLSSLTSRKLPQRVRIPKLGKDSGRVLRLHRLANENFVLATRPGDAHIYSLPLSIPISFESIQDPGKYAMDAALSLYPLVNTTWGVINPSQEMLPASMAKIPQPIEQVLHAWVANWQDMQPRTDKKAMKSSTHEGNIMNMIVNNPTTKLDFLQPQRPRLNSDGKDSKPTLPPSVSLCNYNDTEKFRPPIPNKENVLKSNVTSANGGNRRKFPDYEYKVVGGSKYSSLLYGIGTKSPFNKNRHMASDKGLDSTVSERTQSVNKEMTAERKDLKRECEELKHENQMLKEDREKLLTEVQNLHDLLDSESSYAVCEAGRIGIKDSDHPPGTTKQNSLTGSSQPPTALSPTLAPVPTPRKKKLPLSSTTATGSKCQPRALKDLTVAEVELFLKEINLGGYAACFVEEDVNGKLLLALDEQIMINDLGLSIIDAQKLTLAITKAK